MNRFLFIILAQLMLTSGAQANSLCTEGLIKFRLGFALPVDAVIKVRTLFNEMTGRPISFSKEILNPNDEFMMGENEFRYPVSIVFPKWTESYPIELVQSSKKTLNITENTLYFEPKIVTNNKWFLSVTYQNSTPQASRTSQDFLNNIKRIEISRAAESPEFHINFHQTLENLKICDHY